jgi:hypothetical protein
MADDFGQTVLPPEPHPGPQAALSRSAVVTLAIGGQGHSCGRERGFYRYAQRHLRTAFPSLPTREQCQRHVRQPHAARGALFLPLVQLLAAQRCASEALDSSGVPTRAAKRRGAGGRPGRAAMDGSTRRGWYAGVQVLLAVTPWGMSTGFGCGPASTPEPPLAETSFALRRHRPPGLARGGLPACGPDGVAKGCEGYARHPGGWRAYGAQVIGPPQRTRRVPWSKRLRRWRAGVRQIVETGEEKLWHPCRRNRARPPDLSGLQARLAAKLALPHLCLWLHEQLGRPRLAFADLVAW